MLQQDKCSENRDVVVVEGGGGSAVPALDPLHSPSVTL